MSEESGAQQPPGEKRTLRAWRLLRGLSQFRLAVRADVSMSTVVNIEHNRQIPNVNIADRLAASLGVSMYDIAWPTEDQLVSRSSKNQAVAA